MPYEELHSKTIEKMLKNAVKNVFKLKPVLSKGIRKVGSSDMYCNRVCKPIQECAQCIADLTYKNTNIGFEIGIAQNYQKPVIITRYIPKIPKLTKSDIKILKSFNKKGKIQYSEMPIEIPADINGVFRVDYKNGKELKSKLKEGFKIRKSR